MVMLRLAVAVCAGLAESVTVTVNGNVPLAVAVPEIIPAELKLKPAGRLPVVTAHEKGAVPPLAVKFVEGYAAPVLMEPATNDADVVVTANCALPFVEQPATKRIAIRAEIPRTRDTLPRLTRKLLNIAAILFGLSGLQREKKNLELNPDPETRIV
jgi:hypothetical protein